MNISSSRRRWLLFPLVAAVVAASPLPAADAQRAPVAERAIAVDLTGSGRDAIVLRAPDGEGAVMFLPAADGEFSLSLYTGMGPDVRAIAVADADGDEVYDVVVTTGDGVGVWFGAGEGDFKPEPEIVSMHHGTHPMPAPDRDAPPVVRLDRDFLRALASSPETLSTASAAGLAKADLDPRSLPPGFTPRLIVAGHFLDGGRTDLALVGDGPRPRLLILESRVGADPVVHAIETPLTIFNVNVGQGGGLTFAPATVNIQVNDTVHWIWSGPGHTVTSGAGCTADNLFCSPTNTSCATAPTSGTGATYDRTFTSSGSFPYFCRPHCGLGMTGTVNVQAAASAGAVPDGGTVPGTPLKAAKGGGGAVQLTWSVSCSGTATNYAIYEGTVPIVAGGYSHVSRNCSLGNVTSTSIVPVPQNAYYLIVPETASSEGSYGRSTTAEIPQGGSACQPQVITACP